MNERTANDPSFVSADEERLLQYVDGRLDGDTEARFEARIAADPEWRRRVAADKQTDAIIRAAFDPVLDEPMPLRLRYARHETNGNKGPIAAAVVALLLGALGGWFAGIEGVGKANAPEALAAAAVQAHRVFVVEKRHPVEVAADEEAHLMQWLSRRLGASLRAPDLSQFGYRLMGGRLLPAAAGPAAQLMYEARDGTRLTVYLEPDQSQGETAFRFVEAGGVSGFWWREDGLGYAVLAQGDREHIQPIARGLWEALQKDS